MKKQLICALLMAALSAGLYFGTEYINDYYIGLPVDAQYYDEYVLLGKDAEDAAKREVLEELGLHVKDLHFNHSHYFAPSNTLMLNFTVTVEGEEPTPNREIDSYSWFTPEEAKANIKRNSLAQRFLNWYLDGGEF